MPTAARFDLKLDAQDKDLFSRAASLMGTTMAGFVRSAAKEKAQTLLEQESRVMLSKRDFHPIGFHIITTPLSHHACNTHLHRVPHHQTSA